MLLKRRSKYSGTTFYCVEVGPRSGAGTWPRFLAAVREPAKDQCNLRLLFGPAGTKPLPRISTLQHTGSGGHKSSTGKGYWGAWVGNEVTPTQSYFVVLDRIPSLLAFGDQGVGLFHPALPFERIESGRFPDSRYRRRGNIVGRMSWERVASW